MSYNEDLVIWCCLTFPERTGEACNMWLIRILGVRRMPGLMALSFVAWLALQTEGVAEMKKVEVKFSGGHEIGKKDFGRPVTLIAAALGVEPDLFRAAFSGVTPARGRGPTREEARKNKAALMKVLGPKRVTNERLDEVSNYYRFRPERGELWPTSEAVAYAEIEEETLKRIVVTKPGSGYCNPPKVQVAGFPQQKFQVELHFDKNLKKNGGIAAVKLATAKDKPAKVGAKRD